MTPLQFRLYRALRLSGYIQAPFQTEYYRWKETYCPVGVALDLLMMNRWVGYQHHAGYYFQGYYVDELLSRNGISSRLQNEMRRLHREGYSFVEISSVVKNWRD